MQLIKYIPRIIFQPKVITIEGVKVDVTVPCFTKKLKRQLYLNSWESEEIKMLKEHLEEQDKVLEIGSCIGFLSIYVAQRITKGNLLSIEANPHLIPIINQNMKLNDVNFSVNNCVVGEKSFYDFYINESIISSSLEYKPGLCAERIPGISFSLLLSKHSPNLLIIDIEGGEYELLENALTLQCVRKILIEFHGIHEHISQYKIILEKLMREGFVLVKRGLYDNRVHYFEKEYNSRE